jgi:hypothetical protein
MTSYVVVILALAIQSIVTIVYMVVDGNIEISYKYNNNTEYKNIGALCIVCNVVIILSCLTLIRGLVSLHIKSNKKYFTKHILILGFLFLVIAGILSIICCTIKCTIDTSLCTHATSFLHVMTLLCSMIIILPFVCGIFYIIIYAIYCSCTYDCEDNNMRVNNLLELSSSDESSNVYERMEEKLNGDNKHISVTMLPVKMPENEPPTITYFAE